MRKKNRTDRADKPNGMDGMDCRDEMDKTAPGPDTGSASAMALALQAGAAAEENRIQLEAAIRLLLELAVQMRQEAGLAESPAFVTWRQKGENLLRHVAGGKVAPLMN